MEAAGAIGWAKGFATGAHAFETPSAEARAALAALPALALWGAADRTLAARHFLPLFAEAFPRGRAVELPGVGHYSPEDAPDTVADLVERFFAERRGSGVGRRPGAPGTGRAVSRWSGPGVGGSASVARGGQPSLLRTTPGPDLARRDSGGRDGRTSKRAGCSAASAARLASAARAAASATRASSGSSRTPVACLALWQAVHQTGEAGPSGYTISSGGR
ncbi:hypothetical protein [Kitasatospora sp. NPDC093102]|uniref:alpha/beta fold hydrolase n=1 Tax=Kitasatospora sp. NPDC093102 TaxID=3155069 RepID=UPI00341E87F8